MIGRNNFKHPVNVSVLGAYGESSEYEFTPFGANPELIAQLESVSPGITETAASQSGSQSDFFENLTQLVGILVQGKAQHDWLKINLERAQRGQPPIQPQQYMPGMNLGVTSDTKQMMYIIAAIGFAAFVLPSLVKSRR